MEIEEDEEQYLLGFFKKIPEYVAMIGHSLCGLIFKVIIADRIMQLARNSRR